MIHILDKKDISGYGGVVGHPVWRITYYDDEADEVRTIDRQELFEDDKK